MPPTHAAKLLRAHLCEADAYDGKPLHEAIVAKCRDLGIAGATVFSGLEGYGETAEIRRRHFAGHGHPVVVVVVDSPENIARLQPILEDMMGSGLIAVSDVEAIRVGKEPRSNV